MAEQAAPKYPELPAQAYRVTLGAAGCALDLGDGSERAEYVNQDYLFRTLGRPHRSINLMYCYWPLDKGWPQRASIAFKPSGTFAWDYPYDDYFPYEGGPGGNPNGEPFKQMRDIRQHGQDVTLTLTVDCKTPDDHLKQIARELRPFGRLRVRINHECDGSWFAFNKRYDRPTISAFFNRFHDIIKTEAPEVQTICCWGWWDPKTDRLRFEDDLAPMLPKADVWSVDKYLFLHYAWPNNICEKHQLDKGYSYVGLDNVWKELARVYEIFVERCGQEKPLEICEFNGDGDVRGRAHQCQELTRFYKRVAEKKPKFLKGITMYQFRDAGRLGLEQEDPNNKSVGVASPFLDGYRKLARDPHFNPTEKWQKLEAGAPLETRWHSSEDSAGIGWKLKLKSTPTFLELKFAKEAALVVKVGDQWYFKRPGVEWVDATASVLKADAGETIAVSVFAPPADGTNPGCAAEVKTLLTPPTLRLRYE